MRDTYDRGDVFVLLAKLFWYLQSGRAHVGFLFDYEGNPIHEIVRPRGGY